MSKPPSEVGQKQGSIGVDMTKNDTKNAFFTRFLKKNATNFISHNYLEIDCHTHLTTNTTTMTFAVCFSLFQTEKTAPQRLIYLLVG